MKRLIAVVLLAFVVQSQASAPPGDGRTIKNVADVIPLRVLQRSISPKFYKSLTVSPIKEWVLVRGQLSDTRLSGTRIVRPSLNGTYDPLALKLAKEVQIAGRFSAGEMPTSSVLMHLLIYEIADGTMALSFAHLDGPGGDQMRYWGCARLLVFKNNKWTEIDGPEGLRGKGWAIRDPGLRNDMKAAVQLESVVHPALSDR